MLALQQSALMLSHARRQGDLLRHGYRVDVDLSSHVVVVELEADATGKTAYIIVGPVPMQIKPRGARWTPLFQPCRCRVLARRVLWNWRQLKVHNGELCICNYCLAAHTTCHCVRPCCIWACTAARCVPLACAISAIEEFNFLYVKVRELSLQPADNPSDDENVCGRCGAIWSDEEEWRASCKCEFS